MGEPGRLPAFRGEVERDLNTSENYVKEIAELFQQYGLKGYEADYQAFTQQVTAYSGFLRQEILPRARKEFRLPDEVYAFRLKRYGVDMPVDELRRRASVAFQELQDQLQAMAFRIAQERKLPSSDYRDVLRALKSEQLSGGNILPHYQQRMKTLEEIIQRERIVTLPARSLRIRLATEAESARSPAPFMSPPRLIGNTGEYGEFVLPVRLAGGSDGSTKQMDDFTHEAASWPLAAHEGRPGHELQYASIVEKGVSQARLIFAENSVNVEGWGLYMEEQMLPYIPLEGQFATLWSRMVRAARAFLDPGLNAGTITREEARRVLQEELMLSDALSRRNSNATHSAGRGRLLRISMDISGWWSCALKASCCWASGSTSKPSTTSFWLRACSHPRCCVRPCCNHSSRDVVSLQLNKCCTQRGRGEGHTAEVFGKCSGIHQPISRNYFGRDVSPSPPSPSPAAGRGEPRSIECFERGRASSLRS